MENKKISELTVGELDEIKKIIFKDDSLINFTLIQIAKKFLSNILSLNIYQSNFSTVRNKYIASSDDIDIASKEESFYKEICKKYFNIEHEPKEKSLDLYTKSKNDLKKIDEHISYIKSERQSLENIKKTQGRLNGKERYYWNQLDFYKEKNLAAKNEIVEFITNDIESYALQQCRTASPTLGIPMFNPFFIGSMPYRYSRGLIFNYKDDYDVRNLTDISNKFLDLPFRIYGDIKKLYDEDTEEFYEFAREYISGSISDFKNAISQINNYIQSNHIINIRSKILSTIINHYMNKDFISVVNMLPLQIEGIFHDICLAIGIDESRLDIASINEKLRIIESNLQYFHYFEYYSFKFPVLRNMVAHGQLIEDNLEHTAIMLMLDLLPVCELSTSEEIPINKKIKLINEANKSNFTSLIELLDFIDIEIPKFYSMHEIYNNVLVSYSSDDFWNYLEKELKKENVDDIDKSKTMKFIKKLNSSSLAKNRCNSFFKNLSSFIEEMKKEEADRKNKREIFLKFLKK
jgi:hypothetical protein